MPYRRRPSQGRNHELRFDGNDGFEQSMPFQDGPSRPRRKARSRKPQRAGKKPAGKLAARRSRDFIEGQLYERDRMDGYRDPPQPAEGSYAPSGLGRPMRIGYRS